ncbi:hypothetical protein BD311DRAFT_766772, partial [Dichomitus squalens]
MTRLLVKIARFLVDALVLPSCSLLIDFCLRLYRSPGSLMLVLGHRLLLTLWIAQLPIAQLPFLFGLEPVRSQSDRQGVAPRLLITISVILWRQLAHIPSPRSPKSVCSQAHSGLALATM